MPTKLTSTEFNDRTHLPDWRVLVSRIEATFKAGTFGAGASFVREIATAADAADHHPDVDLRYPGRVRVRLTTHASGGLTNLDVELATKISEMAAAAGLVSEPSSAMVTEIAIDALDIEAIRPFWKAVLGYVDDKSNDTDPNAIVDPLRVGPSFWFQQMDESRPQRNRIHIDVIVPHDEADARVAATLAAGGTLLTDTYARSFWVLADAEGNEACVCTWQDRD